MTKTYTIIRRISLDRNYREAIKLLFYLNILKTEKILQQKKKKKKNSSAQEVKKSSNSNVWQFPQLNWHIVSYPFVNRQIVANWTACRILACSISFPLPPDSSESFWISPSRVRGSETVRIYPPLEAALRYSIWVDRAKEYRLRVNGFRFHAADFLPAGVRTTSIWNRGANEFLREIMVYVSTVFRIILPVFVIDPHITMPTRRRAIVVMFVVRLPIASRTPLKRAIDSRISIPCQGSSRAFASHAVVHTTTRLRNQAGGIHRWRIDCKIRKFPAERRILTS